jgi:hypothetical protein
MLPACVAVIVHVPAARGVSEFPATVQTVDVVEAKLTVRPEVAVAVSAKAEAGRVTVPGAVKLIVCDPCVTVKV